jgi:hypothetical protein
MAKDYGWAYEGKTKIARSAAAAATVEIAEALEDLWAADAAAADFDAAAEEDALEAAIIAFRADDDRAIRAAAERMADESELDALFGRDLPDAVHYLWITGA